jgi:hypothetical protein
LYKIGNTIIVKIVAVKQSANDNRLKGRASPAGGEIAIGKILKQQKQLIPDNLSVVQLKINASISFMPWCLSFFRVRLIPVYYCNSKVQ